MIICEKYTTRYIVKSSQLEDPNYKLYKIYKERFQSNYNFEKNAFDYLSSKNELTEKSNSRSTITNTTFPPLKPHIIYSKQFNFLANNSFRHEVDG